jgi:hypothetical protein
MNSYLGLGSNLKSLISSQLSNKLFSTYSPISNNILPNSLSNKPKTKKQKLPWITYKIIKFADLNEKSFLNILLENIDLNTTYSLLFKIGYAGNSTFRMAGAQTGLVVKSFHNIRHYAGIYRVLISRIDELKTSDGTKLPADIVHFMFKELIPLPELELTTKVKTKTKQLNTNIIKSAETKELISSKYLPLTTDISYFGNLLSGSLRRKYIKKLINNMKFLSIIVPEYLNTLGSDLSSKVFLTKMKKPKQKGKGKEKIQYLTISRPYKSDTHLSRGHIRTVFDMSTGIKLKEVFDYIVDNNTFTRKIKDTKLTIKNGAITDISKDINFNPIFNIFGKLSSKQSFMSNPNFGVLDIETYKDLDGLSKVYLIGYSVYKEEHPNTFYLTDISSTLDSNYLIIHCIDLMLIPKYHNYFFYAHNLGKYDSVFIYKVLKEFNLHKNEEHYIMKTIFRDDVMIKLTISIKLTNKKYIKITLLDSLNYFNDSLDNLSKDYEIENKKGLFPYTFVKKDNLNYVGETPDISH